MNRHQFLEKLQFHSDEIIIHQQHIADETSEKSPPVTTFDAHWKRLAHVVTADDLTEHKAA